LLLGHYIFPTAFDYSVGCQRGVRFAYYQYYTATPLIKPVTTPINFPSLRINMAVYLIFNVSFPSIVLYGLF
jgi:hypothetical protein